MSAKYVNGLIQQRSIEDSQSGTEFHKKVVCTSPLIFHKSRYFSGIVAEQTKVIRGISTSSGWVAVIRMLAGMGVVRDRPWQGRNGALQTRKMQKEDVCEGCYKRVRSE